MKSTSSLFAVYLIQLLVACSQGNNKTIVISNKLRAEGKINKDSTYNGLIKFFDLQTDKLVSTSNYLNGILDGPTISYYHNGNILSKQFYENGCLNGFNYFFDTTGNLVFKKYFYYDLPVGPSITYLNKKCSVYRFYSFDYTILYNLIYDSLKTTPIINQQDNFFFFRINNLNYLTSDSIGADQEELFIYTPEPPNFNFIYRLVWVDSSFKVVKVVKKLNTPKFWTTVLIDKPPNISIKPAIQLTITDSLEHNTYTLFKTIKL